MSASLPAISLSTGISELGESNDKDNRGVAFPEQVFVDESVSGVVKLCQDPVAGWLEISEGREPTECRMKSISVSALLQAQLLALFMGKQTSGDEPTTKFCSWKEAYWKHSIPSLRRQASQRRRCRCDS